ncbi:MAG: hypothetical protein IPL83_06045 [Bdellovibrionales bacterium]|nr:hypothetical protein [Bdellovibrionales bacterium]
MLAGFGPIPSLGSFKPGGYENAKALADIENRQIITPGLDPASIPSFQTLLEIPDKNPPQKEQLYSSQNFSQSPIIFMTFENGIIQELAFDPLYAFVESKFAVDPLPSTTDRNIMLDIK